MSGTTDQTKGRIKEAIGDLTDDKDLQRDGKKDQVAGKLKDKIEDAKDKIGRTLDDIRD